MTDMMIATLTRGFMNGKVTLGMLQIHGIDHDPIYTLENPWLDNRQVVSCIPADQYVCSPYSGTKYKNVYKVEGVPNRSDILLHFGNTEKDTNGCIILGLSAGTMNGISAVLESKKAMDYLRLLIGKKQFILIIKENKHG